MEAWVVVGTEDPGVAGSAAEFSTTEDPAGSVALDNYDLMESEEEESPS